jgi:hypothetical protein
VVIYCCSSIFLLFSIFGSTFPLIFFAALARRVVTLAPTTKQAER